MWSNNSLQLFQSKFCRKRKTTTKRKKRKSTKGGKKGKKKGATKETKSSIESGEKNGVIPDFQIFGDANDLMPFEEDYTNSETPSSSKTTICTKSEAIRILKEAKNKPIAAVKPIIRDEAPTNLLGELLTRQDQFLKPCDRSTFVPKKKTDNPALIKNSGKKSLEPGTSSNLLPERRPHNLEKRPKSAEVRLKSAEVRPRSAEIRSNSAEIRPKSTEIRPRSAEIRPQSKEVGKNLNQNEQNPSFKIPKKADESKNELKSILKKPNSNEDKTQPKSISKRPEKEAENLIKSNGSDLKSCEKRPEKVEKKLDKVELMKTAEEKVQTFLKPFYAREIIDKTTYKTIMRKCVQKVYERSKIAPVFPEKVAKLVKEYVDRYADK